MGLFGRDFNWGRAAAGFFGGPDVVNQFQRSDALRQQREQDEAAAGARQSQVRALRELGWGQAQIDAMSAQDASQVVRERLTPYTLAAGSRRDNPSVNGGPMESTTAPNPTEVQRNYEFLRTQDPGLAESYLARQALIINQGIDPATGAPYSQAIDPRSLYNFGRPPASAPQIGQPGTMPAPNEAQLRAQAAEAIRQGAPPDEVNRRLEEMLRGGAGQPGPRRFPSAY